MPSKKQHNQYFCMKLSSDQYVSLALHARSRHMSMASFCRALFDQLPPPPDASPEIIAQVLQHASRYGPRIPSANVPAVVLPADERTKQLEDIARDIFDDDDEEEE